MGAFIGSVELGRIARDTRHPCQLFQEAFHRQLGRPVFRQALGLPDVDRGLVDPEALGKSRLALTKPQACSLDVSASDHVGGNYEYFIWQSQ